MTNDPLAAPDTASVANERATTPEQIRFGMIVLYVRDLQQSIDFYRLLGLDIPDAHPDQPGVAHRLTNDVTMIITTGDVAVLFDSDWVRPDTGYQQVIEFFVDADAHVDAVWTRLTAAGYGGRSAPGHLIGPYATTVEDPDGNVVLITSEPVTDEVMTN